MKTLKILTIITIILAISAFAVNSVFAEKNNGKGPVKVGSSVEGFELENMRGQLISLDDFQKTKGFILVFLDPGCPFSRVYNDRINLLNSKYKDQGFPVVAILTGSKILRHSSFHFSKAYPRLLDRDNEIATRFSVKKVPEALVLQKKEDNYTVRYIGPIDDNYKNQNTKIDYLQEAVDGVLRGRPITYVRSWPSLGCSIYH